ncbi:hypothetical protein ACXDF8_23995 [Mycolicibacterium sp. CBM1]
MTTDSSEKSPIEKKQHGLAGPRDWSKRPDSSRRCHAHKKNGDQCKNAALAGQSVCKYHGGGSPQAITKARERLSAAADRMAERLLGIAESEKVPAYVALQAVNSVLDRVGITEPKQVEVTVKPIDQIFESIESGSRSDYRRARGIPDPEPQSPAIESHDTYRPGGTLALGPGYVIEGEVETKADDDQDGLDTYPEDDYRLEVHRRATETLANRPLPMPPTDGYLPTDIAMERVAEANRAHRGQLRRR